MEWVHDKANVESREDGTYVVQVWIDNAWMPYHVTQEYSPELFSEVDACMKATE